MAFHIHGLQRIKQLKISLKHKKKGSQLTSLFFMLSIS